MPAIIAHRGASLEAPENTLRSFERAIGIGVDRIELDLRRTADGGIVAIHDADLERLCGDPRRVGELSLPEARALAVQAAEYGTAPNTRIPALDEVLDRIAPRCPLYLELKTDGDPDPLEFADRVLDQIPNGTVHRLASFDATVVARALEAGHRAVLIASNLEALASIEPPLRGRMHALSLRHDAVDEEALRTTRELGIELWTWTVDRPDQWGRLEALGAKDGWCTNDPRGLRGWLRGREL
jgi:glycerophosphoryl diester phosphodiesterase